MNSEKNPLLLINDESTSKLDIAQKNISINITSTFLQRLMLEAGFNHMEREIDSHQFIHFMHLCVVQIGSELRSLKENLSETLSQKETSIIEQFLSEQDKVQADAKMNSALDIFCKNITSDLKEIMIFAKYEKQEMEKNHSSFIKVYSFLLTVLAELCTRYTSRFSCANLARNQDTEAQQNLSENSLFGPVTSLNLIARTRKFRIFFVSTIQSKFALKVLGSGFHTRKNKEHMMNEYTTSQTLSHHSHRKCLRSLIYGGKEALLMQWVEGYPLSHKKDKFHIKEFLTLARDIVTSLLAMHRMRVVHLNLSTNHIIISNDSSASLQLIGYGHSKKLNEAHFIGFSKKVLDKEIHFISPEQTGLNGRATDYRSDFYSLGVIFHQLLTGRLPFEGDHSLKIVRSHILQSLQLEPYYNAEIPKPVIEMISKLMEKNAEERYQSARSILHDIELMLVEVNSTEGMNAIKLAQHDEPEIFLLPQKLYGRSVECKELFRMIENFSINSFEVVEIKGKSGSGKSKLLSELHKPILKINGIWLGGKFEISRSRPLSALLDAIQNFCDIMMLMESSVVEFFKISIQKAVGEEGSLLTELIPSLTKVIGHQPKIPSTIGREAKNRLYYVLLSFFKAICTSSHPIVLILDDVQWLDIATCQVLRWLICDKSIKNLMIILSYRSDEKNDHESLHTLLQQVQESKAKQTCIELENFDIETVNEIVSDIFQISKFEAYSFSFFVFEITDGNPIFLAQLLKSLYDQNLIYFSGESMQWTWKPSVFGDRDYSKDILDLFRRRITSLGEQVKKVLKVASILGSPFSLKVLNVVINSSNSIEMALASGLIVQDYEFGRFSHDAIEHAAYSMLPENLNKLHFHIGMKVWKGLTNDELEENILTVVKLLNFSRNLLEDSSQRLEIISLFMDAAKKAMTTTGFDKALWILDGGIRIIGNMRWDNHYTLCLRLFDLASEAAYGASNEVRFIELFDELSAKATESSHLLSISYLKVRFHYDKREMDKAIETGISILKENGISFDFSEGHLALMEILDAVKKVSHADILKMKEMKDAKHLAVLRILSSMTVSSYFANPQRYSSLTAKFIQLTLQHGISQYTCHGFIALSLSLLISGDSSCYDYGKLALKLLEVHGLKESIVHIYLVFYGAINIWFTNIHASLFPILKAYRICLEVGNIEFGVLCANTYCSYAFYSGKHLKDFMKELEIFYDQLAKKSGLFLSTYQAALHLINEETENASVLVGSEFDIEDYLCKESQISDRVRCFTNCLVMAYLFHDYSSASRFADMCKPDLLHIHGVYFSPIYIFYSGLVSLAQASQPSFSMEYAEECVQKLEKMTENFPGNFENKVHLLRAEMASAKNEKQSAIFHFEKSIFLAKKNCFINEEALACERFGIYLESHSANEGISFLIDAAQCYRTWGAVRKVKHLADLFPTSSFHHTKLFSLCDMTLKLKRESDASVSLISDATFSTGNDIQTTKRTRTK